MKEVMFNKQELSPPAPWRNSP